MNIIIRLALAKQEGSGPAGEELLGELIQQAEALEVDGWNIVNIEVMNEDAHKKDRKQAKEDIIRVVGLMLQLWHALDEPSPENPKISVREHLGWLMDTVLPNYIKERP